MKDYERRVFDVTVASNAKASAHRLAAALACMMRAYVDVDVAAAEGVAANKGGKRDAPIPPPPCPTRRRTCCTGMRRTPTARPRSPAAPHMTAATATARWTALQTDNGELEVACGSKGAAQHEISSPDTSKAAAPGVPAKRPPRPTPLKAPGSDAEEM
eukprot:jgi/Tetstr1/427754/TSEL_017874.t1